MLFNSLIYLLFSSSVTLRRDLSILFNRIAILALQYSIVLHIISLFMCNKGISLHGGLLHISNITQIFQIFIFFISILILQLTSFYPRKVWISKINLNIVWWLDKKIIDKTAEQFKIIEYPAGRRGKLSIVRVKLLNSGDSLKLMIPSLIIINNLGGWINYLCMVISQVMMEREMGNLGSKSPRKIGYKESNRLVSINTGWYAYTIIDVLIIIDLSHLGVKEQRVDSSYYIKHNIVFLRYTLIVFERNSLVRIPSNQNINNKRFLSFKMARQNKSTLITTQLDFKSSMNPWFVTGFSDAEGCFSISVIKNEKRTLGMSVQLMFKINLHKKDQTLLKQIQSFFCVGGIHFKTSQSLQFQVSSIKDLKVIIDHFDKYPLITKKLSDYKLFKEAFYLVQNQEHLTMEGLRKVVAIRASINWGLPLELKTAFMDITPVERPIVLNKKIPDPNWLAGFISGEGCLSVGVT